MPEDGPVQPIDYDANPLVREARDSLLAAPSAYSPEVADLIIEMIAAGYSIGVAGDAVGVKSQTISKWALEDRDGFYERFIQAKRVQALILADQMIEIADDGSQDTKTVETKGGREIEVVDQEVIQRSKLRIDTRRFIARQFLKHIYAEEPEKNAKLDSLVVNIDNTPVENAPLPGDPGAPIADPGEDSGDG